jgi:hypothetical protein
MIAFRGLRGEARELPKAHDLLVAIGADRFKRHPKTLLAARTKICAILFVKVREYIDEDQGHQTR